MSAHPLPPVGSLPHLLLMVTAVTLTRGSSCALRVLGRHVPAGEARTARRVPPEQIFQCAADLMAEIGARPAAPAPQPAPAARRSRA